MQHAGRQPIFYNMLADGAGAASTGPSECLGSRTAWKPGPKHMPQVHAAVNRLERLDGALARRAPVSDFTYPFLGY